jgi:signal transduction histidine kinase
MEKMGGNLTFESPPGQGATFIANLPIAGSETG